MVGLVLLILLIAGVGTWVINDMLKPDQSDIFKHIGIGNLRDIVNIKTDDTIIQLFIGKIDLLLSLGRYKDLANLIDDNYAIMKSLSILATHKGDASDEVVAELELSISKMLRERNKEVRELADSKLKDEIKFLDMQ